MSSIILPQKANIIKNISVDMKEQLDKVFLFAPGKHEIRIIGRWYNQIFQGQTKKTCLLESSGSRAAAFSLGLATSTQHAIDMIYNHFAVDGEEPHNCFIVTNSVADDYSQEMKKRKIGSFWFPNTSYICVKANDVAAINSIIIDIDRPHTGTEKLCASNEELKQLDSGRKQLNALLNEHNIVANYQICSGNGYQLAIFFQFQQEISAAKKTVSKILKGLNSKFLENAIEVDITLEDPSRVSRLAGMLNKKNDRQEILPDRVHRVTTLIETNLQKNNWEDIIKFADFFPTPETKSKTQKPKSQSTQIKEEQTLLNNTKVEIVQPIKSASIKEFDAESYLRQVITLNNISVIKEQADNSCRIRFCLSECLFDSTHKANEASLFLSSDGKICYQCFHNSCKNRTWSDVKHLVNLPQNEIVCKNCGKKIMWMQNKNGKWQPTNTDGSQHKCNSNNPKIATASKPSLPKGQQIWINEKGAVITGVAAQSFFEAQKTPFIFNLGKFWRFENGVWKDVESSVLEKEIHGMIGREKATKKVIQDIVYNLSLEAAKNIEWNKYKNKICFLNCVLDIDTGETEPHNAEYYQNSQIKQEYLPPTGDAQYFIEENAPNWLCFLNSLEFQKATYERLQEWLGYLLIPDTRIEKCLYLKGEGSNGKGTLLRVIIEMLGQDLVSCLEPEEMFEKFKKAAIQNKLANIASDIDTTTVMSMGFKKIVSGELLTVEDKWEKPFKFFPYARFIFAANDFLPTRDHSYGFFRRFDVLEFKKRFEGKNKDMELFSRLQKEIQYILLWAMEGLKRLKINSFVFTKSEEFLASGKDFELKSNPLYQFVEECCFLARNDEHFSAFAAINKKELSTEQFIKWCDENNFCVSCNSLRERYVGWCAKMGYNSLNDGNLGKELKRLGVERERDTTGNRLYFYKGIRLFL